MKAMPPVGSLNSLYESYVILYVTDVVRKWVRMRDEKQDTTVLKTTSILSILKRRQSCREASRWLKRKKAPV